MQRACDYCGEPYEAKRASSRFCSTAHRVANAENPSGRVAPVVDLGEPVLVEKPALLVELELELEAAGRLQTVKGQAALMAAERLVGAGRDGAASYASLLREFRACVDDALEGAAVADDPLDELKARRAARRSG